MKFVIAEACVNWRDLHELHKIIKESARAGADAVKVQLYQPEHVEGHPREEELKNIIIGPEQFKKIAGWCLKENIELIGTPFYPEAVVWMNPHVKRWKIRYADRNNRLLIRTAFHTRKQLLISAKDIKDAYVPLTHGAYIYCTPEYPPKKLHILKSFDKFKGLSSHYPSIIPPIIAAARGAQFLEVHVKLDEYRGDWIPIDDAVSINMKNLKELVNYVRALQGL